MTASLGVSVTTAVDGAVRPTVVILGAGFGGLQACEALMSEDVDVLLVDRHNYNTFQPLLYQVATAGLSPGDIAYPVRSYVHRRPKARFHRASVTGVDLAGRKVVVEDGEPIGYDYLVIATGAATNFFGVKGAAEHARAIYTMEDAVAVRDQSSENLERAAGARLPPSRRLPPTSRLPPRADISEGVLTVVIVGGGPTGVEMAGTLAELRGMRLRTLYPELDPAAARVVLVEQQDRLLSAFDRRLGDYALSVLEDRGVEVRCGSVVREVTAKEVRLGSGEVIPCGLVVWAAGVGSTPLARSLGAALDVLAETAQAPGAPGSSTPSRSIPGMEKGRLAVGADLRLHGCREVFAVGDVAAARSAGSQAFLPQLAQPAIQEGRHAGRQIARLMAGRETEAFVYKDKGIMATIGRRAAVAELPLGIRLRGTPAWVAWLGLHIVFLLGARNRVSVLVNWAWRYLSWRSAPKVIAGS